MVQGTIHLDIPVEDLERDHFFVQSEWMVCSGRFPICISLSGVCSIFRTDYDYPWWEHNNHNSHWLSMISENSTSTSQNEIKRLRLFQFRVTKSPSFVAAFESMRPALGKTLVDEKVSSLSCSELKERHYEKCPTNKDLSGIVCILLHIITYLCIYIYISGCC